MKLSIFCQVFRLCLISHLIILNHHLLLLIIVLLIIAGKQELDDFLHQTSVPHTSKVLKVKVLNEKNKLHKKMNKITMKRP